MSCANAVVILAAGLGTRMKSSLAKVLHPVAGRPMIHYSVQTAIELGAERIVVVVGHQRERVEQYLRETFPDAPIVAAHQAEQLGTAHAVRQASGPLVEFDGRVTILSGDVPTLPTETVRALVELTGDAAVGLISMRLAEPGAYGRIVRNPSGQVERIVEAADCSPAQLAMTEVNAGIYVVKSRFLFESLAAIGSQNAQGEFYLTDLVELAASAGIGAQALLLQGEAASVTLGVNDRVDLARAEARVQSTLRARLMRDGVTMIDPARVYLHEGVRIGSESVIEPDVSILGRSEVGSRCHIEQGARLSNTVVGDGSRILAYTVSEGAVIGSECNVGPFARLREQTDVGDRAKVGNFVETKKTRLGPGAKASHLSYLGDATIGAGANIGAGTITCNYDGERKFHTQIGERAFIGSDTQLVAPVSVGDDAYVGAGTTVTEDVPSKALAISRVRQRHIANWAQRKKIVKK